MSGMPSISSIHKNSSSSTAFINTDIDQNIQNGMILSKSSNNSLVLLQEGGKVGLKNLGNTCYMNSALQCLAHTKELVNYFLTEEFEKDMASFDKSNSHLVYEKEDHDYSLELFTKLFRTFIKDEWSDTHSIINPGELRNALNKICPQFNNSCQQDAHEVLTIILDCLNTQLSRNRKNEYERQAIALSRNFSFWDSHVPGDSIITDLFFGNLKSTIQCVKCNEAYSKIDPFDNLGLPIPYEYKILLYFVPLKRNSSRTIKMFVKINDNMQFKDLLERIKEILSIEYKFYSGIFYWVLNNKFLNIVDLDERCGDLLSRPAFLFLIESDIMNNFNKYNFYVCLNFQMFEDILVEDEITCNLENNKCDSYDYNKHKFKIASFPRIFSFQFSDEEEIDDNKLILRIFNTLEEYIKNFIHSPEDIKQLKSNEFLMYQTKYVENFYPNRYICLYCGKEKIDINSEKNHSKYFLCTCLNKISQFEIFETLNTNLLHHIKNRKGNQDIVLDININISMEILKYRELNRCIDNTQKYMPDTKLDLELLLKYFTAEEKLTLNDNYFCRNCNKNVIAYKKMEIHKYPQILIINLKRFRFESSNFGKIRTSRRNDNNNNLNIKNSGEKNENLIEFPLNKLSLKHEYELFAVINHQGKLDSGHYTALCKHPVSKVWMEYDDKTVRNEKPDNICTPNAYLLFYRKKNTI